jgi:hypothetical protein
MKNVRTLSRNAKNLAISFSKSLRTFQSIDGRPREASFPFISGDTYRGLAHYYFDLEFWSRYRRGTHLMSTSPPRQGDVVFVECILLRDVRVEDLILEWLGEFDSVSSLRFVFGNGDEPPRESFRKELIHRGHLVYSHNVLDGEIGVTPIPLGLQNATHRKFGVLNDFLLYRDILRNPPRQQAPRPRRVFGSFSVGSNEQERGSLRTALENSRFGFTSAGQSVRTNRQQVLGAKFVPSPAGLGPDCYRTWEAIYLGAIPVIRKGTIASSITQDLPIWEVDDWEELMEAGDGELDERYLELSQISTDKALFPYWSQVINHSP